MGHFSNATGPFAPHCTIGEASVPRFPDVGWVGQLIPVCFPLAIHGYPIFVHDPHWNPHHCCQGRKVATFGLHSTRARKRQERLWPRSWWRRGQVQRGRSIETTRAWHGMALTATECSFHQSDQVSHWSQASEDQVWQVLTSGSDRKGYNVFSVLFEGAYPLSVYCRSMERRRLQNDWPKLPSAFQHGFRCALYQVYLRQEISNEVCCWHAYSTIYTLWQVAELICVCWYG